MAMVVVAEEEAEAQEEEQEEEQEKEEAKVFKRELQLLPTSTVPGEAGVDW